MNEYTVTTKIEHDGGDAFRAITAVDDVSAIREARRLAHLAPDGGEWGKDGASVRVYWSVEDADGDCIGDGSILVEIEPDHAHLIAEACGGPHDRRTRRCCGGDPDDHDWTSRGEGGCSENPGVWSTGGTSMGFADHCSECGLRRSEHHTGSQRNPGEHDTTSYEMPATWCPECESEECDCDAE